MVSGQSGTQTASIVQVTWPASSVVPVQLWLVSPEPSVSVTFLPTSGAKPPSVRSAASVVGWPFAMTVDPSYEMVVSNSGSAAAGAASMRPAASAASPAARLTGERMFPLLGGRSDISVTRPPPAGVHPRIGAVPLQNDEVGARVVAGVLLDASIPLALPSWFVLPSIVVM